MTLDAMQATVARLLTDVDFLRRFFGDPPSAHAAYGLTADEFAALRSLDPKKIGISSEGYAGKRFERVESAYPRTLRALEALDPATRSRYLAETRFPPDEATERRTFREFVRRRSGLPADVRRFLDDLADLETLLYEAPRAPGVPSFRLVPDATRPRRTPWALVLEARGPLAALWPWDGVVPRDYPARPGAVLVGRGGADATLADLSGPLGRLLAACDGSRTLAEVEDGFGPGARDVLDAWFAASVVEDAGRAGTIR